MITHNGTYLVAATHHGMPIVAATMGGKMILGGKWLLPATEQAIVAAFGAEGTEVIRKTNDYLNRIATTDPQRALLLSGFINEDPLLAPYLEGEFKYYLDARDGLQDGKWVDRFNPAIGWQPQGNCKHTGDGFSLSNTNNATMYMNQGNLYDLGNHFKVVVEFTANADAICIDFGSVTEAQKNTSFQAANGFAEMNWKMLGNYSNPGVKHAYTPMTAGRHTLTWEIRDAGNGKDFFRFTLDRVAYDGAAIIPQATEFGGYKDWNIQNFYMARGVAGTQFCPTNGTIHKMMIFVLD